MSVQLRMMGVGLALGILLLAGNRDLHAQTPSNGGGAAPQTPMGGFAGIYLLSGERIQQELKITEGQKTQLQELTKRSRQQVQDRYSGLDNLSVEERRKRLDEIKKQMPEDTQMRMKLMRKEIADILTPEQQKRWRQIELQQEGPAALERPEVAETVGLSDEQKTKIAQVNRETQDKTQALYEDARKGDPKTRTERMAQLRDKARQLRDEGDKTAMAVLQPEQKKKLGEMLGEPFPMERVQFLPRDPGEGALRRGFPKP